MKHADPCRTPARCCWVPRIASWAEALALTLGGALRTGRKRAAVSPKHFLVHDRLAVRLLALLAVAAVVFVVVWALSYAFLPEGVLRGRTGGAALAGSDLAGGTVWLEWLRILAINLAVTFLLLSPPT